MKICVFFSLLLFLLACHCPSKETRQFFITGTYATWERGNLSRSWDTLVVTGYAGNLSRFIVSHFTRFQRTIDPFTEPPEYNHCSWTAFYDPNTHALISMAAHPDLVFSPDPYTVTVNGLHYVRIQ